MISTVAERQRREREEDRISPIAVSNKKHKSRLHDYNGLRDAASDKVGATELASAFALASLASMSPQQKRSEIDPESRDAENGHDHIPISPETRSPVYRHRRVTFSNDTKQPRLDDVSRSVSFSPRTNRPRTSRLPPGFGRPSYPSRLHSHAAPFWVMRHHQFPNPQSAFGVPMTSAPQQDKWICDFCNMASFDTYEEACFHEDSCHMKCTAVSRHSAPTSGMWHHMQTPQPAIVSSRDMIIPPPEQSFKEYNMDTIPSDSRQWYQGSISLAIPDSDKDWLSNANCYIRATCVEAFTEEEEDSNETPRNGRLSPNKVGIRCCFCRHRPYDERKHAAVSYPSSIGGIYEVVKRWQRVHLELCSDIPKEVKNTIEQLGTANAWVPTTRQYWVDSARAVGLVDTNDGIRFSIDPKKISFNLSPERRAAIIIKKQEENRQTNSDVVEERKKGQDISAGESIVFPEDMSMVPPYVYFLMCQVESTHFTEADRFVARSKGPVGYPGFQCRHCHGHAGLGKYFPVSCKSLSTNSTSQNIHSHLLKCRKVNPYIKDQLLALKDEKSKSPRLEPGWRRIFFEKIWGRLHDS